MKYVIYKIIYLSLFCMGVNLFCRYLTYQLMPFNHKFLFSQLHILSMYICNFTFSKLVFCCLLLFSILVPDTHIIKKKELHVVYYYTLIHLCKTVSLLHHYVNMYQYTLNLILTILLSKY